MSSIKHLEMPATCRLCAEFPMPFSIPGSWPVALALAGHGVSPALKLDFGHADREKEVG